MNTDKFKIEIKPSEYKGWKLEYAPHYEGKNFRAKKKAAMLFECDLPDLLRDIDEAEKVTALIDPPISAYKMNSYAGKRELISIHAVIGNRFYYTDELGDDHGDFLENVCVPVDGKAKKNYIRADENTEKIYDKLRGLEKQHHELNRQEAELRSGLKAITEVDILTAIKKPRK